MKLHKILNKLVSLLCVVSLLFSLCSTMTFAVTANAVTATTSSTVKQGNTAYCYVYIDTTEGLAALDVTIHYDPAKVKITNVYNSISCTLYDSVTNPDNIQFSYILDGKGAASKTQLFYFRYQVLSGADIGDAWFDITIGEAYDTSLNEVAVTGSRCSFTIAETVTNKSCSIYGSAAVSTAVGQEFTLDYRFSTYQIASGTAVITYDPELFQVANVTNGTFLNGKVADINTDLIGTIYISFVGTEYNTNTNLVSVTFRTIKNVAQSSPIVLKTPELLDKELNKILCTGYTTNVTVAFDDTYVGDAPAMWLDGVFSREKQQIVLTVNLEAGSHLGAGDFVICFDPTLVSYNSCTKGFSPSFFHINEKNASAGELKFHIISLSDIITEETVLTVVFDIKNQGSCSAVDFALTGTGLTDSLTEGIQLNFIGDTVKAEYQVTFLDVDGSILQTGRYAYGEPVIAPSNIVKDNGTYAYTVSGWDQEITDCAGNATYRATGGIMRLLKDTVVSTLVLRPNTTLDLNGKTLSADLLVAMNGAGIMDGGVACAGGGLLKIPRENLALDQDNGGIIPVWNGVDGYVFTRVTFQTLSRVADSGVAQYIFLPGLSNKEAISLLADGGLDNGLKIQVRLTWNDGFSQQFYTYSDDLVEQVFDGSGSKAFDLIITGIVGIEDMDASAVIVTDSGPQAIAKGTILLTD